MALAICPALKLQVWTTNTDGALIPLAGGKVYTYITDTTTPLTTYVDADQNAANTNPIRLDSRGEANCFLLPRVYDIWVYDENDNFIEAQFKIQGSGSGSGTIVYVGTIQELKDLTAGSAALVFNSGYYTAKDTCNGEWVWDASSTATADDVFVVSPSSLPTTGRYLRLFDGETVSVKFAGIIGDVSAQDYTILNSAIANSYPTGIAIEFPPGAYLVNSNLSFPLSDITMNDGAYFYTNNGVTLTISKGFKKGRETAFSGLGTIDLSNAKIDSLYPEWFGSPTNSDSFFNACASNYPGVYSLDTDTDYTWSGSFSFPGSSLLGNNAIVNLADNVTLNFGERARVSKLSIQGGTSYTFSMTGGYAVADQVYVRGLSPNNRGTLNLDFTHLELRSPQVSANGSNTGAGAIYVAGGTVNIMAPKVTNESGSISYGYIFADGAKVILYGVIPEDSFLVSEYLDLAEGGVGYAIYSLDCVVPGDLTVLGNVNFSPGGSVTFNNVTANGTITSSTNITAGVGGNGRFYGTVENNLYAPGGQLFFQSGVATTGTSTAEVNLMSQNLIGNIMSHNGDKLIVRCSGVVVVSTSITGQTRTWKLYIGATVVGNFSITTQGSPPIGMTNWYFEAQIYRTSATAFIGTTSLSTNYNNGDGAYITPPSSQMNVSITGFDWSIAHLLQFAGQSSDTTGSVGQNLMTVDFYPSPTP